MPYRGAGATRDGEGRFFTGLVMMIAFDLLVILVLLIGGIGLFLRSLRGG